MLGMTLLQGKNVVEEEEEEKEEKKKKKSLKDNKEINENWNK